MKGVPYVSIAMQASDLAVTAFTTEHPGVAVDAVFEGPARADGAAPAGAFMVSGLSAALRPAFLAAMAPNYESLNVVEEDDAGQTLLCTFVVAPAMAARSISRALDPLDARFDAPWVHVEGSEMEIRLVPQMDPDLLVLATAVEERLNALGVPAAVTTRNLDFGIYQRWKRILDAQAAVQAY